MLGVHPNRAATVAERAFWRPIGRRVRNSPNDILVQLRCPNRMSASKTIRLDFLRARIAVALPVAAGLLHGSVWALTMNSFVSSNPDARSFCLFAKGRAAHIFVETNDWPGVARVAADLQTDIRRVAGLAATIAHESGQLGPDAILIGTIGKSAVIDQLIREGKIEVADIAGKWESALIQVVENPLPGVARALVIAGSDKRGTIYGVYDLSAQIGVSPWHWWADVPAPRQAS